MGNDELVEFYLEVKHETEPGKDNQGAFLCTDGVNEFWLPKSLIDWTHIKNNDYEILVPRWKAEQEGMV